MGVFRQPRRLAREAAKLASGTREGPDLAATGRGTLPGRSHGAGAARGNEESRFRSLLGALSARPK